MRCVAISVLAALSLSACATVSMVPGEAVVETNISAEQSQLREAVASYNERAETAHWVTPSKGFFDMARVLIDGVGNSGGKARSYADFIEADSADLMATTERLAGDIGAARVGLEAVSHEATMFIESATVTEASLRKDVTSFESALVTAQKSRRSFVEAIAVVEGRGGSDLTTVEMELAAFDQAIDHARNTANRLAQVHSSMPAGAAVS